MMNNAELVHDALSRHFLAIGTFAGVPLVGASVVGLIISFLQAVTQIQDQTLPQLVKVLTISLILLAFGTTLVQPLVVASAMVFDRFWWVG